LKEKQQMDTKKEMLIELVQQQRAVHKKIGGRKLFHLLDLDRTKLELKVGRDKFFDLLRSKDLLVKHRRKYAVTTDSGHRFGRYDNLVSDWHPGKPNELWVADITYLRTRSGFVYLSLLTDAYSRKIVGWHLSNSLAIEGALRTLKMAIKQAAGTRNIIHHSDQGIQYCCKEYVKLLKKKKMKISMAAVGNCYENAMAERVNGILKNEYGLDETFKDLKEATEAVKEAIKIYNEMRPHWALQLRLPAEVHLAA
jgi:putative transposase